MELPFAQGRCWLQRLFRHVHGVLRVFCALVQEESGGGLQAAPSSLFEGEEDFQVGYVQPGRGGL